VTTLTYVVLGTSLLVRVLVSYGSRDTDNSTDATPFVVSLALAVAGIIHGGDPLNVYGLSKSSLYECSWRVLSLLWITAFIIGRLAITLFIRTDMGLREALEEGIMSPGGVYLSLRDYSKFCGLILALPMVCSQTFMEEFIFRGLLVRLCNWLYSLFGMPPHLVGFLSIMSSSVLFGLIHFVPAFHCLEGKGIAIPLYALIMPTILGVIFSLLNRASCSLWPGWIVHFSLNYSGFVWDRLSGKWEMWGLK
jgi:membrane protease YdiL (CAAX protease family)